MDGVFNGFNYSLKPFNGQIEKGDELVNFPDFTNIVYFTYWEQK